MLRVSGESGMLFIAIQTSIPPAITDNTDTQIYFFPGMRVIISPIACGYKLVLGLPLPLLTSML